MNKEEYINNLRNQLSSDWLSLRELIINGNEEKILLAKSEMAKKSNEYAFELLRTYNPKMLPYYEIYKQEEKDYSPLPRPLFYENGQVLNFNDVKKEIDGIWRYDDKYGVRGVISYSHPVDKSANLPIRKNIYDAYCENYNFLAIEGYVYNRWYDLKMYNLEPPQPVIFYQGDNNTPLLLEEIKDLILSYENNSKETDAQIFIDNTKENLTKEETTYYTHNGKVIDLSNNEYRSWLINNLCEKYSDIDVFDELKQYQTKQEFFENNLGQENLEQVN